MTLILQLFSIFRFPFIVFFFSPARSVLCRPILEQATAHPNTNSSRNVTGEMSCPIPQAQRWRVSFICKQTAQLCISRTCWAKVSYLSLTSLAARTACAPREQQQQCLLEVFLCKKAVPISHFPSSCALPDASASSAQQPCELPTWSSAIRLFNLA